MYCEVNVLPVSVEKTPLFAIIVDPVNVEKEVGNEVFVPLIVDAVSVEKTLLFAIIVEPVSVEKEVG
jgi:hypothetical protein